MIILDSLHKNFNNITLSLLKIGNKTINKIQSILQSKKYRNISKQITGRGIDNHAIAFKDWNGSNVMKKNANSHEGCYNCNRLEYFDKDGFLQDKCFNWLTQYKRWKGR